MDRREYQVFGPPGTGKTTYLAARIKKSAEVYGSAGILVASFTRAAAAEIASRGLGVQRDNVGTLHAICYRGIGGGKIAETMVDDWNTRHSRWALSKGRGSLDDPSDAIGTTEGDQLMQRLEVLRAGLVPRSMYPTSVLSFADAWGAWKREMDCIDFTDMVEIASRDLEYAPGGPTIGVFDEVQDFTPLELGLIRKWSQHMSSVVLAGDDDQSIYHFKGADPAVFFGYQVPPENKIVLDQSYRVPRVVQQRAESWIRRVQSRQEKVYRPRDFDGELRRVGTSFANPAPLLRDAEKYLAAGKRVMFLATCSYMLEGLKSELRVRGYPFHNPYRVTRGDWNPLARQGGKGQSTIDRLLAYLLPSIEYFGDDSRPWTLADLKKWGEMLSAKGIFRHGRKALLELVDPASVGDEFLSVADLMEYFTDEGLAAVMNVDPSWFYAHAAAARKKALEYPVRVLERAGRAGLEKDPQIVIGTIHSVKGGEVDVVYLSPDMSVLGMRSSLESRAGSDAVTRQFYVGMTRARESLVLCAPGSRLHVKI